MASLIGAWQNVDMQITWDPPIAATNLVKQGVTFEEAAAIFGDPLAYTFRDPGHSVGESRFLTIGLSARGRLVIVSYSERAFVVRLISARRATRQERKIYEEN